MGALTTEESSALRQVCAAISASLAEDRAIATDSFSSPDVESPWKEPLKAASPSALAAAKEALLASTPDLLRFCRARDFQPDKVCAMALKNCEFLARVQVASLCPAKHFPNFVSQNVWRMGGYSRCGYPIMVVNPARWTPSKMHSLDEAVRAIAHSFELGVRAMAPGVEKYVVIFDLPGFGWQHCTPFAMRCIAQVIKINQDQYPERLAAAFLLNAPWVFRTAWKVIRPLIDPVTAGKVHFLVGSEQPTVLETYIEPSVLESSVGGLHPTYPTSAADTYTGCLEACGMTPTLYDPSQPDPFVDLAGGAAWLQASNTTAS